MSDFKIRRDNLDADIRSFHGEARQLNLSAEEDRFAKIVSVLDKGQVSAFEKFATSKGLVQNIEMTALPTDFGSTSKRENTIRDQLEAFKAAREEPTRPSFTRFIGSMFKKEKGYEETGLGR